MFLRLSVIFFLVVALSSTGLTQEKTEKTMPVFCQEYLGQVEFVKGRILQLAEAIPQAQYTWRPAEGVRSVSETFLHTAGANYYFLKSTGQELPAGVDMSGEPDAWDKSTTDKKAVVASLQQSFDALSGTVKKVTESDLNKTVQAFGTEMSQRNFMISMLNHMHEHLGQSIAYARSNGIVPPWSQKAPEPPKLKTK